MRMSCLTFSACLALGIAAASATACSASAKAPGEGSASAKATTDTAAGDERAGRPHEDGVVRIPEASRQFVEVEIISDAAQHSTITAPARVDFRDGALAQLGAPLDGRVVNVQVEVGSQVKPGDPVVTLDCPEAADMRAQVDSVRASLREARAALERQVRMLQQGVGTEKDRLAAETRVMEIEADLTRVEADAAFVGAGSGTTVVLRSPMAGRIITRKATVGLAVQKGADPIVEIGNPDSVWVVADLFERDLPLVRLESRATIEFQSVPRPIAGRVASIGAVVASGMRTVPLRIAVDTHADLKPGMYGRVQLQAAGGALTIPTEAILIKDGKESIVYVEKAPLTFERRSVTVAQHVGGRIQITSGLAPGDKVVVRGALLLDNSAEQLL